MMDIISVLQAGAAAATENVEALQAGAAAVAENLDALRAANVNGSFTLGVAGAGAGIGIGLTGYSAAQAVGRNPGAFGNILTISIIAMALAEAIAIYALVLAFQGR